jgi:hypothetical protein
MMDFTITLDTKALVAFFFVAVGICIWVAWLNHQRKIKSRESDAGADKYDALLGELTFCEIRSRKLAEGQQSLVHWVVARVVLTDLIDKYRKLSLHEDALKILRDHIVQSLMSADDELDSVVLLRHIYQLVETENFIEYATDKQLDTVVQAYVLAAEHEATGEAFYQEMLADLGACINSKFRECVFKAYKKVQLTTETAAIVKQSEQKGGKAGNSN